MKVVLKNKNNINCNIISKIKNTKIKKINMYNNIVINDAIRKKICDCKIFGRSQQITTTGKNLFNISVWEKNPPLINNVIQGNTGNVVVSNGTITINSTNLDDNYTVSGMEISGNIVSNSYRKYLIPIKPNTNYTISFDIESDMTVETNGSSYYSFTNENYLATTYSNLGLQPAQGHHSITITSGSNDFWLGIRFGVKGQNKTRSYSNIEVYEEGTQDTDFEPYTGGKPSPSPDYPQVINGIRGIINLINVDNFEVNNSTGLEELFDVKSNTSYCLTFTKTRIENVEIINTAIYDVGEIIFYNNSTILSQINGDTTNLLNGKIVVTKKFQTPENCNKIKFTFRNKNGDKNFNTLISDVILEEGNISHDYVPSGNSYLIYKNQSNDVLKKLNISLNNNVFRSINDVYDELIVDTETGDYYKINYIRHLELAIADMDNSEDYPGWKNVSILSKDFPNSTPLLDQQKNYLCNICKKKSQNIGINTKKNNNTLFLNKFVFGLSMSEWKSQYPDLIVEIDYTLDIPDDPIKIGTLTTEQLENLKLFDGYNNITFVTGLDSEQEVSYFTKEFNDMSNYKYKFRKVDKL